MNKETETKENKYLKNMCLCFKQIIQSAVTSFRLIQYVIAANKVHSNNAYDYP